MGHDVLPVEPDEDAILKAIVEGTARVTGTKFFDALVTNLAKAFGTHGAWVTEYIPETKRFHVIAFWLGGQMLPDYEMQIEGSPCEVVITELRPVHHPEGMQELYGPRHKDLRRIGAVSYMGVPLLDANKNLLGHMAVVDTRPMPAKPRFQAMFEVFAARAAAEIQRLRAESEVREREEKLRRLVDSAMDGIIELDHDLHIERMNSAAEKIFACRSEEAAGMNFMKYLTADACQKLTVLTHDLQSRPEGEQYVWIPGSLQARQANGKEFTAEASISRFEVHGQTHYSLILRNVNERLEAEKKIQSLSMEAQYLREEIEALQDFGEVIGRSSALVQALRDVQQVAATDSTVLILGETGTGKEQIAHAIHTGSSRKGHALIKVNCAAIPPSLMESEFFGHEAGAFTGATRKREGRFELADKGTIFLDEIGELPLDIQAKLLRVLQEQEFEPVGSSRTRKINVRVVAATNRDLRDLIRKGQFREDLYYRIHVFPIQIPPLRERGDDVILLAQSFAERFGRKMGRAIKPLSTSDITRLKSYHWPGNVRELQNVIERAVITSNDGTLNLLRALPEPETTRSAQEKAPSQVLKAEELNEMERQNFLRALELTGWRIAGKDGAAELLGLKPSTLNSRMKALKIQRPRPS